ncbi:MAG TPA: LLM class F420-dependent oxidoreductase [Ilumatobacteraceae bacterium]|nr:LLM class F420-dependent oxidoreductase [Ilumatobacteraceae bacterium]
MRIGTMSEKVNDSTIEAVLGEATEAHERGLDTLWVPQIFGHDSLTVLAIVGREVPDIELGTAVVPTYPRHPMMLAQQALTVQAAIGGRLALGIGLSHKVVVESMWGLSYERAARHMREYLSVLMPLLESSAVQFEGEEFRVQGQITVAGSSRPSVVVAALGKEMLRIAGRLADGTSTWCVGAKTLEDHIIPTIRQAAADAGRPEPRIVCSLPVLVTDDIDAARAKARKVFAVYTHLPSYRAMMDVEGVADASALAVLGTEAEVAEQIEEYRRLGVTDFNAGIFSGDREERARTFAVLSSISDS